MPQELDLTADTLTSWALDTPYDTFISFSERQYALSKKAYAEIKEFLKREMSITESNKGESVNAGKQRIRDLLQRSRSIRADSGVGTERVEPRKIDVGTGAEVGNDTAIVIREARTAIASAGAKEQDSGAKRANRESERKRQSIERELAEQVNKWNIKNENENLCL
jgi:hypothetical protein